MPRYMTLFQICNMQESESNMVITTKHDIETV